MASGSYRTRERKIPNAPPGTRRLQPAMVPPREPELPSRERMFSPFQWKLIGVFVAVCLVIFVAEVHAGAFNPAPPSSSNTTNAQTYPLQIGGSQEAYNLWAHSTGPIPIQTALPTVTPASAKNPHPVAGYSVLGKPTISVAQINTILAYYHSPTAGMGQSLYDLGVQYGIDPVYAIAFFMHESSFGTAGEARATLSLGNERCIPDRPCIDQDRGGYAKMNSWQDGFEHWYKLIRNLYVAQWGRVTVDQIIPKYAPNSDGNDEAEYIASLKHEVDEWRAGNIAV